MLWPGLVGTSLRSEAGSKPAKEQETLFCRGEAQQEGSGKERIYNIKYTIKEFTPGKVKSTVRCPLGSLQPHTWVPGGMSSSAQLQAGVLHSSRKDPFIMEMTLSLQGWGLGRSWRAEARWRADGGVKNPPCMISVVQTSKAIPNYPRECTEGMSECAAICELLQPPLHHSRGGMCCFLDTGKKTDALLPASLWPPPVSIISLLGESHSN